MVRCDLPGSWNLVCAVRGVPAGEIVTEFPSSPARSRSVANRPGSVGFRNFECQNMSACNNPQQLGGYRAWKLEICRKYRHHPRLSLDDEKDVFEQADLQMEPCRPIESFRRMVRFLKSRSGFRQIADKFAVLVC